jgi:hypothetical protein
LDELPDAAAQENPQDCIETLAGGERADKQKALAEESQAEGAHLADADTEDAEAQVADDRLADAEDARDRREQDGLEARVAKLRERLVNRSAGGRIDKVSRGVVKKVKQQAIDRIDALRQT